MYIYENDNYHGELTCMKQGYNMNELSIFYR